MRSSFLILIFSSLLNLNGYWFQQVQAQSIFDLASVTKQFTSASILLLEEEGKLSLDDTLLDYFPDAPADKAAITIQQLLNHTSGITKVPRNTYYEIPQEGLAGAIFNVPTVTVSTPLLSLQATQNQ